MTRPKSRIEMRPKEPLDFTKPNPITFVALLNNIMISKGDKFPWTHAVTGKDFLVERMRGELIGPGMLHVEVAGREVVEAGVTGEGGKLLKAPKYGPVLIQQVTLPNVGIIWWE